ncbi:M3 family metallopeptidase [Nocardioides caldifontis]|uniref:M3 family metallopeptidase n=1 Tax=Nocardioides caldifontis TaxID=2588938 RepID=UPI0011DFFC21|nr:M3 family metallopeptidase [Nocardioides caldifontis]
MTDRPGRGPAPLVLPGDDWGGWLDDRCARGVAAARAAADRLRALGTTPSAPALEVLQEWNEVGLHLDDVLSVTSLLSNVHPDEQLRDLAQEREQEAHRLLTDLSLDRGLYDALDAVDPAGLADDARRMLDRSLRDFHRSGVDRDEGTRERLRELSERQTVLGQQFSRTIRDDVRRLRVEPERLAGLPDDWLDAHPPDTDGLVEVTTDYPDYVPVMTFGTDRTLREELVRAYLDRGWPDNDAVLRELLEVRRETAQLLGYEDWPSYDAEVKMIGSGAAIGEFVDRITELADGPARRDFQVLLDRVRQDHPDATGLTSVDKVFYAEVIRREQFAVDAQEVRRYLDFTKVRRGLLEVTGRLFGVEYVEVPDAPVWHDEVTVHDVVAADRPDRPVLGRIYLDLHPRPGKYSHAAQFTLTDGVRGRQLPEGVLVCNFPRGLMEHDQVVTLFHEFGHLVHHVLGGHQEWVRFSGVATEWDFVEAPSQMLEEWAWDHAVLSTFATDADGTPIPAELVERMRAAEEFGKGYLARTQMFYAALSYAFHRDVPEDLTAASRELQRRYDLFAPLEGTHFHTSFGHLGGYTSAYYTYMWSLVIAKDLFSAFDRDDLLDRAVARRYRDAVLAPGGSRDAADLVASFLGRPYGFDAFEAWLAAG